MVMTGERAAKILAAVALASCCSLEACKRCGRHESSSSEGRPSLAGITVLPIAPALFRGAQVQLDKAEIAAKVKGVLEVAGVFSPPSPLRPTAQVGLEAEVSTSGTADAPEIVAKVRLRIAVRPASGAATRFNEDVAAVGQTPLVAEGADQARAVFQRLVERIAGDLLLAYAGRLKLWEADVREIASTLQSVDNELRVEALHVIGARQLRALIPTALQLLSDEDEGVRDAALGALVALRERSAVKALAESRQMRDTREMRKILDAIASLGGSEARDYLSFVAETHDDEEIRAMASEALDRLLRHPRPTQTTK